MSTYLVVLTTCPTPEEARTVARALVEERLAACVQICPAMECIYRWQGKIERAAEQLLLIKTSQANFDKAAARIQELHSYEVPEVIALPVTSGSEKYLSWLQGELHD